MKSTMRRMLALAGALAVLAFAAPPADAATFHIDELRMAPAGGRVTGIVANKVGVAPAACDDPAHRELGGTWPNGSYSWSFNASSTPNYLRRSRVRDVLIRSFSNITGARNDCGMADNISATHTYLGTTASRARCGRRDSHNVIGFHRLEFGVLAVTCYWLKNGRMVEADIQINSDERWALSVKNCFDEVVLEATMTHEAGHVFGLDHVGERRHGRLTMSTFIDGPCQNAESTLGRGDILGLQALY